MKIPINKEHREIRPFSTVGTNMILFRGGTRLLSIGRGLVVRVRICCVARELNKTVAYLFELFPFS